MYAMRFEQPGLPLVWTQVPDPQPDEQQVLIRIHACGVCRTDLHLVDGELPDPKQSVIPGHEIVGEVIEKGAAVDRFNIGDRVGVPWLGWTCGECEYCQTGRENLCGKARFTGYQIDGGYAEYTVADQRFCFAIDAQYSD
ncbi:MAG: alcohol dehydrogenase catalytic domain-containing protein, partial [Gammaproteobacteria bacterium]|nr:alcohol dehydrogenase catalytic domain-containing protein [Gammaproteobacteria bacterium]